MTVGTLVTAYCEIIFVTTVTSFYISNQPSNQDPPLMDICLLQGTRYLSCIAYTLCFLPIVMVFCIVFFSSCTLSCITTIHFYWNVFVRVNFLGCVTVCYFVLSSCLPRSSSSCWRPLRVLDVLAIVFHKIRLLGFTPKIKPKSFYVNWADLFLWAATVLYSVHSVVIDFMTKKY